MSDISAGVTTTLSGEDCAVSLARIARGRDRIDEARLHATPPTVAPQTRNRHVRTLFRSQMPAVLNA
ncbi:hypothetical protein FHR56_002963 [Xanthomonas sacchari]|nr:hypothetical protein [Xanthomonas sp. F10]